MFQEQREKHKARVILKSEGKQQVLGFCLFASCVACFFACIYCGHEVALCKIN